MPQIRRSFVRELLALIPNLDTEFSGQIKLLSFDEMNTNEVLLEITPLKGYYAHASFVFRIRATPNYPFQVPKIHCASKVFHPNINPSGLDENVCLNFLNNWCARYGLKDLLNAILFLFYEPNFDDPLNGSASVSENGLTMEQTIRKSLYGGVVNDVTYDPNAAWIQWAEENGIHPSIKECSEKALSTRTNPPAQQQSSTSNYFRQAISGQYTSVVSLSRLELPYYYRDTSSVDFAYIRHITVRPIKFACDSIDAVNTLRRYYYLEQSSYEQQNRLEELDIRSVTASTLEHHQFRFDSKQSSLIGFMNSRPSASENENNNPFFDYPLDETPQFILETEEIGSDDAGCETCFDDHASLNEQTETVAAEMPEENVDDATTLLETETDLTIHEPQSMEDNANDERDTCVQRDVVEAPESPAPPVEPIIDTDPGDDARADEWEGTANAEAEHQDLISDNRSEEVLYTVDADYDRQVFWQHETSARQLWPWWWIVYQSRWPAYLAPHHITQIRRTQQRYDFVRASSVVLRSDLFRLGMSCDRTSVYLLLDSLTLSPFSPILNRAAASRMSGRKIVTWYGLDWYSVSDAFRPIHNHESINPSNHFHIPILPFTLFYLHNWIAYMSRVELYGSSLGYSRPRNPGTLTSMASTCLTPANLGCGQCCYADGWPLWLLWRVSRLLCRLLATSCSRSIRGLDKCDLSSVKISLGFPFSDLDEI